MALIDWKYGLQTLKKDYGTTIMNHLYKKLMEFELKNVDSDIAEINKEKMYTPIHPTLMQISRNLGLIAKKLNNCKKCSENCSNGEDDI